MLIEDESGELIAKLIKENEKEAIKSIGNLMFTIGVIYIFVGFLFQLSVFHGSKHAPLVFIFLSIEMFAVGTVALLNKKKSSYLKTVLTISLLVSVFVINIVSGYSCYFLYALPITLSCRFYDKKLTTAVGIASAILIVYSTYVNAYYSELVSRIDLNTVVYDGPITLQIVKDLNTAVIDTGFDSFAVFLNGVRSSGILNVIIVFLVTLSANVYIKSCQKLLNLTYSRKQQIDYLKQENESNTELIEAINDFISEMMYHASTKEDVKDVINALLAFIGNRIKCDRTYIFEKTNDNYSNTFEWCSDNSESKKDELQNVPYEILKVWFDEFEKKKNIVISNVENYKDGSKEMHDILTYQKVHSLVAVPIVLEGKINGFFGIINPADEDMELVSRSIDVIELTLEMLIKLKNTNDIIVRAANEDPLTSCYNRHALDNMFEKEFDKEKSIGLVLADLNGLKQINDNLGHIAGDNYILDAANILKEVYGKQNVYRIGGDEFLVVLIDVTQNDFETFNQSCKDKAKNTLSLGTVFKEKADIEFEQLFKMVDAEMYKSKAQYYKENNIERRIK